MNQEKSGLGAGGSAEDTAADDPFEAYRKRMMLGYKYRPNPCKLCPGMLEGQYIIAICPSMLKGQSVITMCPSMLKGQSVITMYVIRKKLFWHMASVLPFLCCLVLAVGNPRKQYY